MTARLSKKMITFDHPFDLDEIETTLPAGSYTIETEEEPLNGPSNGPSFLAFRPIATTLIIHPPRGKPGRTQYWEIDPAGLAAAHERDQSRTSAEQTSDSNAIASAIDSTDPETTQYRPATSGGLKPSGLASSH